MREPIPPPTHAARSMSTLTIACGHTFEGGVGGRQVEATSVVAVAVGVISISEGAGRVRMAKVQDVGRDWGRGPGSYPRFAIR